jgi:thiol-disulfide isomerase/thioredoxin
MKMKNCFAGRLARFSVVNRRLLSVALLSVSLLGVKAQGDADAKYAADLLRPGTEAPDFVIANAGADYDGTSLSSLRGKYVVLDFWASWCPDCRKDIKKIRWMNRHFASDSIVFIGMSFDKTEEAWRKCVADSAMRRSRGRRRRWPRTIMSTGFRQSISSGQTAV